jgi:hypothetical protein
MCDAFYMLILFEAMGHDYVIWDKAATIRFRRPGRGTVSAEFQISPETIADLRQILETAEKHDATFRTQIKDASGEVIADVEKVIHFRPKKALESRSEHRKRT